MAEPITIRSHTELNELVAEKVMGWQWTDVSGFRLLQDPEKPRRVAVILGVSSEIKLTSVPSYSTDVNEAEQVAWKYELNLAFGKNGVCAYAEFHEKLKDDIFVTHPTSTSMAICLAALKCKGIDVTLQLDATT